ncbi:Protein EXUTER 1, chloroplastic [Orobanche hederae]
MIPGVKVKVVKLPAPEKVDIQTSFSSKAGEKGRTSFTLTVEEDASERLSGGDGQSPENKRAKLQQRSIDHVMLDLMESTDKGKIPMKGLYIGAQGRYTSEVIHMKRRFGQWKEDGNTKIHRKIDFYEYVEAVKLTGDAHVPAGQVAFRAKVGKRYQLPHKGIIPEEFGVARCLAFMLSYLSINFRIILSRTTLQIARYRGQGRLAEPGFRNPRWVDGELVILGGRYIKGPPVVGFIYGAPDHHFLVFFNRLKLLD